MGDRALDPAAGDPTSRTDPIPVLVAGVVVLVAGAIAVGVVAGAGVPAGEWTNGPGEGAAPSGARTGGGATGPAVAGSGAGGPAVAPGAVTVGPTAGTAPYFAVNVTGTNSPVVEGETLAVEARVANRGNLSDVQTITLSVNGTVRDSANVSLQPGNATRVTLRWGTRSGDAGDYRVTVRSRDDAGAASVRVLRPASFAVNLTDTNSPVTEGETLAVDARVTNTGDVNGTQNVSLSIDGVLLDRERLALGAGRSRTVTLEWTTARGDAGNYTARVATENDAERGSVTVLEPANFSVEVMGTNSPVVVGENLTVEATVTNTGDVADTRTARLTIDGSGEDWRNVTLAGGESQRIAFRWPTRSGDGGNHTARVEAGEGADARSVTVTDDGDPPSFAVNVTGTNSPVVAGENLTVTARVTNTGDVGDTQRVILSTAGTRRSSGYLDLSAGESRRVTLEWRTTAGDGGNYTASVASENDSDERRVTVENATEGSVYAVNVTGTNAPVAAGTDLVVEVTVTNTGDAEDYGNVTLAVDRSVVDESIVRLAPGETTTERLVWRTDESDDGNYTASVESDDDSADRPVTVLDAANFSVRINRTNSPVAVGESLTVETRVSNPGDVTDTRSVVFSVDGLVEQRRNVTLEGGQSTLVDFEWLPGTGDAGEHTARVETDGDAGVREVRVRNETKRARLAVRIDATNSPVREGERLFVGATVTNLGNATATGNVTLSVDGHRVDGARVRLGPGETSNETLTWRTRSGDAGNGTVTVRTENDSEDLTVTVLRAANFSVNVVDYDERVVEGETFTVVAEVVNTGDVAGARTVRLAVGPGNDPRDARTVSLSGSERTTVELQWETTGGDAGEYTALVTTANDSETVPATVEGGESFSVRIDRTNSPVAAGEQLVVEATVTNVGGRPNSTDVSLVVPSGFTVRDRAGVTLDPGESASVTLRWTTASNDVGGYTASVETSDGSATRAITVQRAARSGGVELVDVGSNTPVVESQRLAVSATLANRGEEAKTRSVELAVAGSVRDETTVSVGPGNRRTVTLYWTTERGDAGSYEATVTSGDDTVRTTVGVNAPSAFNVSLDGTSAPVLAGEVLRVNATVVNSGEVERTERVVLAVGGEQRASRDVTLDGGQRRGVTLVWTTPEDGAGEYGATVATGASSDGTNVTVRRPATFDVEVRPPPGNVTRGEELAVRVRVTNRGDVEGNRTVAYRIGGETVATRSVTLAGRESTTLTFAVDTDNVVPGNYSHGVATADDEWTDDITVERNEGDGTTTTAGTATTTTTTTTATTTTTTSPTAAPDRPGPSSPSAEFTVAPRTPDAGETVTFDAAASAPAEGESIARYEWDLDGDGDPEATGRRVRHTFESAQIQTVTLTVVDEAGDADAADRRVYVSEPTATRTNDGGVGVSGPTETAAQSAGSGAPNASAETAGGPLGSRTRIGGGDGVLGLVLALGGVLLVLFAGVRYRLYRASRGSPGDGTPTDDDRGADDGAPANDPED